MTGVAARLVLGPVLGPFLRRHSDVRLEVVAEERLVDAVASGFDAGIRFGETVPQDMIAVRVGVPHRFAVVRSLDYLARHGVPQTPDDLARHRCLRWPFTGGGYLRWSFARDGRIREVADGRLVCVLGEWCGERSGFSLHYPSRRQVPPALRALIDMLKAEALASPPTDAG